MNSIPHEAVRWCWLNGIQVYPEPSISRKDYFKIVVDMEAIETKISEGYYHIDRIDSKVWEVYLDIYLMGASK